MMRASISWSARAVVAVVIAVSAQTGTQGTTTAEGQWPYLGGSASHTRYSPLNQINASNFDKLKVAWVFHGDNFGPGVEFTTRATPIYVDASCTPSSGSVGRSWRSIPPP
jgi:quinoprotein glucose dehydrogenase